MCHSVFRIMMCSDPSSARPTVTRSTRPTLPWPRADPPGTAPASLRGPTPERTAPGSEPAGGTLAAPAADLGSEVEKRSGAEGAARPCVGAGAGEPHPRHHYH